MDSREILGPNCHLAVNLSVCVKKLLKIFQVDIASSWDSTQTVTTLEDPWPTDGLKSLVSSTTKDSETGLSKFVLTVYAVCTDGSINQIYEAEMRTSSLAS